MKPVTGLIRTLILAACLFAAGCSTNISRYQMPGTDLGDVQRLYYDPPEDERQAAQLRSLITTRLEKRGYEVVDKSDANVYGDGDYVLDVAPDWHWDLTWYLLELRLAIYDPADETLIAQAQSQQTSMVRKNLDVVVDRTIASLFNDPVNADGEE